MGLILNKIIIEDYLTKELIYSKEIRGKLPFFIETHNLNGSKNFQIFLFRQHPRIKEFLEKNNEKNFLKLQETNIDINTTQLKIIINDKSYMISTLGKGNSLNIREYNLSNGFSDFPKGKTAMFFNFIFTEPQALDKIILELKEFNEIKEDTNEK